MSGNHRSETQPAQTRWSLTDGISYKTFLSFILPQTVLAHIAHFHRAASPQENPPLFAESYTWDVDFL